MRHNLVFHERKAQEEAIHFEEEDNMGQGTSRLPSRLVYFFDVDLEPLEKEEMAETQTNPTKMLL